jgi:hypothetical protein
VTELLWSFGPWLVFLVASRVTNLYGAAAAGAATAVIVTVRALVRHRVHLLDIASLVYFVALVAVLVAVHPGHLDYWARYAQAGSHTALTLIVFGSILVNHPFTESYARESVPREFWGTPRFKAVNRQLSAVWGIAFAVGTISLLVAGSVDDRQVLLRIVVPFGAYAYAYSYTQKRRANGEDPEVGQLDVESADP